MPSLPSRILRVGFLLGVAAPGIAYAGELGPHQIVPCPGWRDRRTSGQLPVPAPQAGDEERIGIVAMIDEVLDALRVGLVSDRAAGAPPGRRTGPSPRGPAGA